MSDQKLKDDLKVIVNYPAAKLPFEQEHASPSETVGTLKSAVLNAFGLTEGQSNGSTYTYTLFHSKTPLENLNETPWPARWPRRDACSQTQPAGDARVNDELSRLNLREDFAEACDAPDAGRWKLELSSDLEVLVTLSPAREQAETFQARLLWTRYPDCPPSLKFRDPKTARLDVPQAWPMARGLRPQSLDACVNWCAEGFSIHPEWKNDPRWQWNPRGNPLLWVLRQLQEELDEHYQGRFR